MVDRALKGVGKAHCIQRGHNVETFVEVGQLISEVKGFKYSLPDTSTDSNGVDRDKLRSNEPLKLLPARSNIDNW